MSIRAHSGKAVAVLAFSLLGVLVAGAIVSFVFRAQAIDAQAIFAQAESRAAGAEVALEEGQEATRLAENKLESARASAQQRASDFADARFYCDVTDNAIVFDDVRWCDVSEQRLDELEDADREVARLGTELQISEDALPQLEADLEAALDETTSSRTAAQSAESLFNVAFVAWVTLSALLATATLVALLWGRQPEPAEASRS